MPKVAIFIFTSLLSLSVLSVSYASIPADLVEVDNSQNSLNFSSGIVKIDPDFFVENDYKRYLVFGTGLQNDDLLKNSSLHRIDSDVGFFSVSVLSEKSASGLISRGYHVVEDFKLDFHSLDDEIRDASKIGDITGSSLANKRYGASGNGTVIAVVDTGVDFSNP